MTAITMIIDLQYGSTGKGLIASYVGHMERPDAVVSANMPNAGHTAYDNDGVKFVHKVLPSAIFHNPLIVGIGPGAVFSPEQLKKEILFAREHGHLTHTKILIHENAVPLVEEDVLSESNGPMTGVASTAQGSAAAMIRKIHRDPSKKVIARDVAMGLDLPMCHKVSNSKWQVIMRGARHILAEGAQGYSLGINQSFYPYCTSRDCSPTRFMSDMALPWRHLSRVIGSCRTFPIRVGNTDKGKSGDYYDDQKEMTWEEIGVEPEMTTVTGRVRRVFSWSFKQFDEALLETCATEVFLNFMNYLPEDDQEEFLVVADSAARRRGSYIRYLGFGPKATDIVER